MKTEAREGDMVENSRGAIFDVKGLVHPHGKVVAFIRYFQNAMGERKRNKVTYEKVYSLAKRFEILKEMFPQYIVHDPVFDEILCEVPVQDMKKHYRPFEKFKKLRESSRPDALEAKALHLLNLLVEKTDIPLDAIGISGSILVKLHKPGSDIDVLIYGSRNCSRVYSVLGQLLKDKSSPLKSYNKQELVNLFDFRSKDTAMSFEDFVRTESKKVLQGTFLKTDYFVRFVKDWNEVDEKYGDIQYRNVGYTRIEATVIDDSEAIFTPCIYRIANVKFLEGAGCETVKEITSFRGRFCEQAKLDERVVAQGKIEQVTDTRDNSQHFRLLVGNNHEDFIVPQPSELS